MQQAESFQVVFFRTCNSFEEDKLVMFRMQLWSLWQRRNVKHWEEKEETAYHVISRAVEVLQSWRHARGTQGSKHDMAPTQRVVWKPPPAGHLKCNIDAAIFWSQNRVGAGPCVRNAAGQFFQAYTVWCTANMSPTEAEAWGLIQTLLWLYSMNISILIIEMDSKQVVDDVQCSLLNLITQSMDQSSQLVGIC